MKRSGWRSPDSHPVRDLPLRELPDQQAGVWRNWLAHRPVLGPYGGHILHACPQGPDPLPERGGSPCRSQVEAEFTGRGGVLATCCNSPMFLEFTNGHWLSLLHGPIRPRRQSAAGNLRTMTKDLRIPMEDNEGVPAFASHSGRFMWRLLKAWAAMGFRSPKINYVKGHLP